MSACMYASCCAKAGVSSCRSDLGMGGHKSKVYTLSHVSHKI